MSRTTSCRHLWAGRQSVGSAAPDSFRFRCLVLFIVPILLAACRPKPALTPQQLEGKRVYDVGCAHCHEENDLDLQKVPPNLHSLFNHEKLPGGEPATDSEVGQIIMKGKGTMPPFAYQMSREQMAAVVAYLHAGVR